MSAPSIEKLRATKDEELIKAHDNLAVSTNIGLSYYIEELARRHASRQTEAILNYTKWVALMTGVITIATLLNLWIAFKLLN